MNGPPQQQPQQPGGQQLQFGPESLISLLMSMLQGGPQAMGPAAGSGQAVGQNSMASLLPMLLQSMQPQQPPAGAPGAAGPPGSPGAGGGGAKLPGGQGGAQMPGGQAPQQNPQLAQLLQMLSSLGMGGGGTMGQSPFARGTPMQ
jgi:hypothetical protein